MSAPDTDRMIRALTTGAEALGDVAAVFLFGSWARGNARADSDVDVAVLLGTPPTTADRLGTFRRILAALGGQVAADRLDLVILDDAPPALAFQVLRDGRLIACRDEVAVHRFRVRTYRVHADYEPVERLFRNRTARLAPNG